MFTIVEMSKTVKKIVKKYKTNFTIILQNRCVNIKSKCFNIIDYIKYFYLDKVNK